MSLFLSFVFVLITRSLVPLAIAIAILIPVTVVTAALVAVRLRSVRGCRA